MICSFGWKWPIEQLKTHRALKKKIVFYRIYGANELYNNDICLLGDDDDGDESSNYRMRDMISIRLFQLSQSFLVCLFKCFCAGHLLS